MISLKVDGFPEARKAADDMVGGDAQLAQALNKMAFKIAEAMPGQMERAFDRPVPFTLKAFGVQRATPKNLRAVVYAKDRQAQYLWYEIEGGARTPSRRLLRLPAHVRLNMYGNLPAGLIRELIDVAKHNKVVTAAKARRAGIKMGRTLTMFYGDPGDARPIGIYQRQGPHLVPVVVMPKGPAKYSQRFDFYGIANSIFEREFPQMELGKVR